MNRSLSSWLSPSIVTCRSCIASSSAACVFGRSAVDLVGEQQLGEDRAAGQREARGLEVEQVGADDVGGHQVRRELDAPEIQPDRLREAVREQRLGRARRTFEQDVPAGEQRDQHQLDARFLADDRLGDLRP